MAKLWIEIEDMADGVNYIVQVKSTHLIPVDPSLRTPAMNMAQSIVHHVVQAQGQNKPHVIQHGKKGKLISTVTKLS